MTVLMTTHQPEHALLLNAQVVAISAGRLAATGPAQEVLQAHTLAALYGTAVGVLQQEGQAVACVLRL